LYERLEKGGVAATTSIKVTRPQVFNETLSKVSEFVTACRLYIRMKMKGQQLKSKFNGCHHMYREGQQMCERKIY